MRITLDLDEDVLRAAKDLAQAQRRSIGEVITELARSALSTLPQESSDDAANCSISHAEDLYGFDPIPTCGKTVSNSHVDALRDVLGI